MLKDYYKILGISRHSSSNEIKTAYRRLSLMWHPDKNIGKDTTQQMIDINEAYGILKDSNSKSRYDLYYDKVFANTSNHSEFHQKSTKKKESYDNQSKQHSQSTHSEPHNHSSFDYVDDDILKDKIQQERQNAEKLVRDFINNLNKDAKTAVKGATDSCLIYMVIAIILNIISELSTLDL